MALLKKTFKSARPGMPCTGNHRQTCDHLEKSGDRPALQTARSKWSMAKPGRGDDVVVTVATKRCLPFPRPTCRASSFPASGRRGQRQEVTGRWKTLTKERPVLPRTCRRFQGQRIEAIRSSSTSKGMVISRPSAAPRIIRWFWGRAASSPPRTADRRQGRRRGQGSRWKFPEDGHQHLAGRTPSLFTSSRRSRGPENRWMTRWRRNSAPRKAWTLEDPDPWAAWRPNIPVPGASGSKRACWTSWMRWSSSTCLRSLVGGRTRSPISSTTKRHPEDQYGHNHGSIEPTDDTRLARRRVLPNYLLLAEDPGRRPGRSRIRK